MQDGIYRYQGYLERIYLQHESKPRYDTFFLDMDQKKWLQRAHLPENAWVDVTFGDFNGDPKKYKEQLRLDPDLKHDRLRWPPEKKIASMVTREPVSLDLRFKITAKAHKPEGIDLKATFLESGSIIVDLYSEGKEITVTVPQSLDNQTAVHDVMTLSVFAKSAGLYVSCPKEHAPNFSVFGGLVPFRRPALAPAG